jgi:hypothetical protein
MNEKEILEFIVSLKDSEFEELVDAENQKCVSKWISHEMDKHPDMKRDQAIAIAYSKCGLSKKDSTAWFSEDSEFGTVNRLNNVLKIPVILAKEMVQEYDHGRSKHFKPYEELQKAVKDLEDLPVIIEHKQWTDDDVVGYIKEFKADDKDRSIKGTAYLTESSLPEAIADILKKNMVVPVSIGFWADLGDGGEFNGEKYDHVQRDMALNHLAICIRSIARCPPNQCGLNLDSEKGGELDGEILINKGNYYYYITKNKIEENEINTKIQEIGDNMGDIRNFNAEKYIKEPSTGVKEPTSHSAIAGNIGPDLKALFAKLLDWVGNIPKENIRKDAEDLLISIINHLETDDQKMGDNEELTKLESRIKQLEDSIKEKEEIISAYEEEKKASLIADIKKFTVFEDSELADKCVKELEIIADTVSKFEPTMAKPKTLPKQKQDSTTIDEARLTPYVFSGDYNEDEE